MNIFLSTILILSGVWGVFMTSQYGELYKQNTELQQQLQTQKEVTQRCNSQLKVYWDAHGSRYH